MLILCSHFVERDTPRHVFCPEIKFLIVGIHSRMQIPQSRLARADSPERQSTADAARAERRVQRLSGFSGRNVTASILRRGGPDTWLASAGLIHR